MTVRVVATDTETGDQAIYELEPGEYALVCVLPCRLALTNSGDNGMTGLFLSGCAHTAAPIDVPHSIEP